jgi:hypothetical protein
MCSDHMPKSLSLLDSKASWSESSFSPRSLCHFFYRFNHVCIDSLFGISRHNVNTTTLLQFAPWIKRMAGVFWIGIKDELPTTGLFISLKVRQLSSISLFAYTLCENAAMMVCDSVANKSWLLSSYQVEDPQQKGVDHLSLRLITGTVVQVLKSALIFTN